MEIPDGRIAVAPGDRDGDLSVLVVDAEGRLTSQLAAALEDSLEGKRLALARASDLRRPSKGSPATVPTSCSCRSPHRTRRGSAPLITCRAEAPALPIVVLCASGDEPLAVKAVQLGATDCLVMEGLSGACATRFRFAIQVEVAPLRAVLPTSCGESPVPPAASRQVHQHPCRPLP